MKISISNFHLYIATDPFLTSNSCTNSKSIWKLQLSIMSYLWCHTVPPHIKNSSNMKHYPFLRSNMNINSPSSITISGIVILQSLWPIDPQKGPRNIVSDANFCIVEGSQTVTMALLRYFAPSELTNDIQNMTQKPFQKAFIESL